MNWKLLTLPIIAAFIGWGTNVIAIRMLFWPREPINLLGWRFLGVLPKRKLEIARSIGEVLDEDLLPVEELIEAVNTLETREKVAQVVSDNLTSRIDNILPRFIAEYAGERIKDHLNTLVSKEMESLFEQLGETLQQELQDKRFLGELVEAKISSFDLIELERLVLKVAKNELRHIEIFGAVLGLIIGIVQALFIFWI